MGRIQRQTLRNIILSYIGLVLGYINIIILFPLYFTEEEFGLTQLLAGMMVVYSQLSAFGLVSIIVRFFPFFKTGDKKHNGFLTWVMLIASSGFIIVTLIYLISKPLITDAFIENSALYIDYYYFLIPLAFFLLSFSVFEAVARSIHRTVFSAFLRDVLFRVLTTIGIFLVFFKVLNFEQFIIYYILANGFISLLLLIQIIRVKEFKFTFDTKSIKSNKIKEVVRYGLFTLLAGSSYFLAQNIDKIMIGSMVGLKTVAIYSVFIYMATVIAFPARSMYRIVIPTITEAWKEKNLELIHSLYKRTSLILMIVGSIIYIGIIVNADNVLHFIQPDYRVGFIFFIFLGLSFLIDISGGINSDIISTSVYYKYDTLFNIIYMVLCASLNYILITLTGALGAAIATAISMLIFNFLKWIFLFRKFKMQPFNYKNVIVILVAAGVLLIGIYLPRIGNVYIDILYRSFIVAGVYFSTLILLKVSSDLNEKFVKYYKKIL